MPGVLNRRLYSLLKTRFGAVKTQSDGERMIARTVREPSGEPRLSVSHAGEYYRVCCPYCNDTRFRLYVNHMFGKRDRLGRTMNFLAVCYNEHCLDRYQNVENFVERLNDPTLSEAYVARGVTVPEEAREVLPPGPCTPLAELPKSHPAVAYVRGRGFDHVELSDKFSVSFCTDSQYSLARNRIIIPVLDDGKLKGWQARFVGDLDWKGPNKKTLPPKYFSTPNGKFRSQCIYNFDRMKEWETAVIVEGPTDAWRFGSMSGCIFGNSMTEIQRRRFVAAFKKRTAVLLLDPEEYESKTSRKLVDLMTKLMPGRFCSVKLPDGTDPGSLDRDFLKAYVKEHAAEAGVKVRYRKVA